MEGVWLEQERETGSTLKWVFQADIYNLGRMSRVEIKGPVDAHVIQCHLDMPHNERTD